MPRYVSALHRAARDGDMEEMERLVRDGAGINEWDSDRWTPLHYAARDGHVEAASWLLQHRAQVDGEDVRGWTPLHCAAVHGYRGVVEALLQHRAPVDVKDRDGWTPLHRAAMQGHRGVMEALLQAGADPRTVSKAGHTPLHLACRWRHTQCVQLLSQADRGVIDVADNGGNTALHAAITWKQEVVQLLIQAGADLHIQNKEGKSPLFLLQEDPQHWSAVLSSLHISPGRQQGAAPSTSQSGYIRITLQDVDPRDSQIKALLSDKENVYPMSRAPRGRAIIINNMIFDHPDDTRYGSQFDSENLMNLFARLGYETDCWENLTLTDLLKKIKEEKSNPLHAKADVFAMFILSHGKKGRIACKDGLPIHIHDHIITNLSGRNFPQLIGKPKLFFIQACQGSGKTIGQKSTVATDSGDVLQGPWDDFLSDLEEEDPVQGASAAPQKHHEMADFLIAYATYTDYAAFRHTVFGSTFVREFVNACNEFAHTHHILDILTKVKRRVSEKEHLFKQGSKQYSYLQMPRSVDTLTKSLYFFPGYYQK